MRTISKLFWFVAIAIVFNVSTAYAQADATYPTLLRIKEAKSKGLSKISFKKGVYHFFPEKAMEEFCYISNHNDVLARVAFPLEDMKNLTIDGGGSTFIFHGRMIGFLLKNCENISVKNLTIDYSDAFHSEALVVANNASEHSFDIKISEEYPYEIRNEQLIFIKPYYEHDLGQSILYDPQRKAIAYQTEIYTPITTLTQVKANKRKTFNYRYKTDPKDPYIRNQGKYRGLRMKELEPGLVRIYGHRKKLPPVGMILVGKGEQGTNRFAPAFKMNDVKGFYAENVTVNHAGGMGFLAENCENVDLNRCTIEPSGTRMVSTTADATHFVGCRGKVTLRNCRFQNQLDDAMNVHGTYQEVMDILGKRTVGLRMGHFQQLGFRLAVPGDTIGLVRLSESFFAYDKLTVKSIEFVNGRYQVLTFNENIPAKLRTGDLLENLTAYPDLTVENCNISRNRARGLLISTPKKTLIKNNFFSTEMEAILIPVESSSWYESGNAANITIVGNTFQDCTSGGMDRGVIRFHTDEGNKNVAFKNIVVENNTFNQFDSWIMEITNVDGLLFKGNKITNTGTFKAQFPERAVVSVHYSKDVRFENNTYEGKAKNMVEVGKGETPLTFK